MNQPKTINQTVPTWFWIAAALALLFEAAGCVMYLSQVTTDHSTLPLDERAMWAATPTWVMAAYAVAVWVGLVGALLLLLRRRVAVPVLFVSLIAVIVQFSGLFIDPQLRQTVPESALIVPVFIIFGSYVVFSLARLSRRRGWLR